MRYKIINLLSIDVALGAVVSAAFFARILNVAVLPQGYVLLGMMVWLIYTADHLIDAWSMKEAAVSERHLYHQKNFTAILVTFLLLALAAISLVFLIRIQLVTAGLIFGSFVIVYLIVNRWLTYFKELSASILYTGGVLLPAWSLHEEPLDQDQQLLISIFALIVLTNMLIFARASVEEDKHNRQRSLATVLGPTTMNRLIRFVAAACLLLLVLGLAGGYTPELLVLFVMEVATLLVFELPYFQHNDRYRIYGDAVFLLPLTILFI